MCHLDQCAQLSFTQSNKGVIATAPAYSIQCTLSKFLTSILYQSCWRVKRKNSPTSPARALASRRGQNSTCSGVGEICHHGSVWDGDGRFGLDSSPEVPKTCRVTELHFSHRHGTRYTSPFNKSPDRATSVRRRHAQLNVIIALNLCNELLPRLALYYLNGHFKSAELTPFAIDIQPMCFCSLDICPLAYLPAQSNFGMPFLKRPQICVTPLTGIRGCPEQADGMYPVNTFVAAQETIKGTDWEYTCHGDWEVPAGSKWETVTGDRLIHRDLSKLVILEHMRGVHR